MTALNIDMREMDMCEVDEVNGGFGPAIAIVGLAVGIATFSMMVGERLHDAHCTDHR